MIVRILEGFELLTEDPRYDALHDYSTGYEESTWSSADEAITWARERASTVYIDVWEAGLLAKCQRYSAGEHSGELTPAIRRWPGADDEAKRSRAEPSHSRRRGVVWIWQQMPLVSRGNPLRFSAVVEAEYVDSSSWEIDPPPAIERSEGMSLESALGWAAERSEVIVVGLGAPTYSWFSAGSKPAPEALPRLPVELANSHGNDAQNAFTSWTG
jgi:hypothetical protein